MNSSAQLNQFEMFNRISHFGIVDRNDKGCFSVFKKESLLWPNMTILNPNVQYARNCISEYVNSSDKCTTLMLQKELLTENDFKVLANASYMPVGEWVNMTLSDLHFSAMTGKDKIVINEIDGENSGYLSDWNRVIGEQLFRGKQLDKYLVKTLSCKNEFKLYGGRYDGVLVSTGLVFYGSMPGVYMIATEKPFQGLGFGRAMMQKILNDCVVSGYKEICLQSTGAGLNLYKSLGFTESGKSVLFFKIS